MKETKQILVIGAGYAGLMAAMRLRKRLLGSAYGVMVVDSGAKFRERVRLHQFVVGQKVRTRSFRAMLAPAGIQFCQGKVIAIDRHARQVTIASEAGQQQLAYHRLIYTLGSHTDSPINGVVEHAYRLDHGDAEALRRELIRVAQAAGKVTVVGAGGTGLEIAAELAEHWPSLDVTLLNRTAIGDFLSVAGATYVQRVLADLGVQQLPYTVVSKVLGTGLVVNDGRVLKHDLCIWTGGFAVSSLAASAGLAIHPCGQLKVNDHLQVVNDPYVFGAGDAVRPVQPVGAPVRMSLYTALFMGAYVADAVAGDVLGKQVNPFSFSYIAMGISLGRRQGLVQFLSGSHDRPLNLVLRGRPAIWFKEFFTHFGLWAIRLQRFWPAAFYWLGKNKWRRLPSKVAQKRDLVET